jgi:transcriptional regulator with XRE-family HTH domain
MSATMTALGRWLRHELNRNGLTQNEAAVYAGVASATLSEILNKGHVPKVETLFRLADYFETPRVEVLRVAGHLPPTGDPGVDVADEPLIRELVEEFRQVPDEWKPVAVEQIAQFRRLAELRPVRMVGEEADESSAGEASAGEDAQEGLEEQDAHERRQAR